MRNAKWLLVLTLLMASTLGLSACGSNDDEKSYNQTDAAFAANMLPHHEGGVKLGEMAVKKGVDPKVKSLGQDIVAAQTRESETLQGFLRDFGGVSPVMPAPIEERDMMDMKKLAAASGQEFDLLWLEVISGHHSAAIQMAEIEKTGGKSPEAKKLATSIIDTQSSELTQFSALLKQME
ncbi:MAG: DUF305 domain-containing protein [Solirubrobacteraceae bacterium]